MSNFDLAFRGTLAVMRHPFWALAALIFLVTLIVKPIVIHNGLSDDARQLICDQLGPQIADVHAMMLLPIDEDAGLKAGCNLASAQMLNDSALAAA